MRVILGEPLLAVRVALGVLLTLAATRGASSLLFGLQPHDPLTLMGAAVLLVFVAFVASCARAAGRACRSHERASLRVIHGSFRTTTRDESSPRLGLGESTTDGLLS
jgi:hypothetical protein